MLNMTENIFSKRREPFIFMLYLGIGGSILLFSGVFLIFFRNEINSFDFKVIVPGAMWLSTLVIVLSSIAMYISIKHIEKQDFTAFRQSLTFSYLLGYFFIFSQIIGWYKLLYNSRLELNLNSSNAIMFVLSLLHVVHTGIGLIAFSLVLRKVFKNKRFEDSLVYSVNPPNVLNLSLMSKFWYFLAILWIFIFSFMVYHAI